MLGKVTATNASSGCIGHLTETVQQRGSKGIEWTIILEVGPNNRENEISFLKAF